MSNRATRRGTCLLAWLVTLAVPAATVFVIGWFWLGQVAALEQEIAALDLQMVRHQGLLRILPGLRAELEQVNSHKDVEDFYFDAKTPALAGAKLQSAVEKMVNAAGGHVTSTQLLPSPKDARPPMVRVRTQIKGATDVLLDVLYQIEQARPFLFVEKLSVRAPARPRTARRATRNRKRRPAARRDLLTVRLDVFGYALRESP